MVFHLRLQCPGLCRVYLQLLLCGTQLSPFLLKTLSVLLEALHLLLPWQPGGDFLQFLVYPLFFRDLCIPRPRFFGLFGERLLQVLHPRNELIRLRVRSLELPPPVNVHWLLQLLHECAGLCLFVQQLFIELADFPFDTRGSVRLPSRLHDLAA